MRPFRDQVYEVHVYIIDYRVSQPQLSPVHLVLTHGSKHETLCDSVHSQQQHIHTVPAQEGRALPRTQQRASVHVQSQQRVRVTEREDGESHEENKLEEHGEGVS